MKDVQGVKLTFDKKSLANFTDGELKCLYIFPHILNRLKMLEAQVFSNWTVGAGRSMEGPVNQAALCGVVESIFLMAGELKEAWEAIQNCYYKSQVSKSMHSKLPDDIQAKLKKLPEYFSNTSLTTFLRNNFSYHNSPDRILESAKLLAEDDLLTLYLFQHENNYFDYVTKLRLIAVAEYLKLADWSTVIQEMLKVIVKGVLTNVSNVLNAILASLFAKVAHKKANVTLQNVKCDAELSADFYFYVDS